MLQIGSIREGHRVHHEIDRVESFFGLMKHRSDIVIIGNIARYHPGITFTDIVQRFAYPSLVFFARQMHITTGRALRNKLICNMTGDATIVGNSKNKALLAIQ